MRADDQRVRLLSPALRASAAAEWAAHQARLTEEARSRHEEALDHFHRIILPQSRRLRGK